MLLLLSTILLAADDKLNDFYFSNSNNVWLIIQVVLYILGGIASGATLLIYFIRRFIKGYDLRFEQYDNVLEKREEKADRIIAMIGDIQDKWEHRESKIITMIEEIQNNLQDFRIDMTKYEMSAVSKDTMSQIMTKLAVIENTCAINHKQRKSL